MALVAIFANVTGIKKSGAPKKEIKQVNKIKKLNILASQLLETTTDTIVAIIQKGRITDIWKKG